MSSDDDEKHPFEYLAENQSKQKKRSGGAEPPPAKAAKQTTLGFKATAATVSSDDDDDDDGFNFMQHKPKAQDKAAKPGYFTSTADAGDDDAKPAPKKKAAGGDGRILVRSKWPRGKKPLPMGWSACEYKIGGKEKWIFSHPLYGESQNEKHVFERKEEDWRTIAQSRRRNSGGASSGAGKGKASSSSTREEADEEGEGEGEAGGASGRGSAVPADDDDGDDLSSLLNDVQKKEERHEAMKERVHAEMSMRLDTGVRVNPALRKMFGS